MVVDAPFLYTVQTAAATAEEEEQEKRRVYQVTDGLKSPDTKRTYRHAFKHFVQITVKNDDLQALIDTKPSVIESKIISHIEYLKDVKKLKYWSIQVYCAAILHFFEMNDVSLNTKKIKRFLPCDEGHYNQDRPYSINEIQQILDKCDVRSRVIILLMVSTGMRIGALPGLLLEDVKKIDEFGLYLIRVYNNSKKDRYYTFCTPECYNAITEYLEFRKRCGEEVKEKSFLIRSKVTIDNPFTAKIGKPVTVRAIQLIIEGLLKQAGLKQKQVMRTHGFRKFYANQCSRAHIDYPTREYLIGHRLPGQEPSYNRMTEEDRLNEYVKAIPYLTIFESTEGLQNRVNELEFERSHEISILLQKDSMNTDAISALSDKLQVAMAEIEKLKNRK
jgi:site-specific recombinase XerD